MAAYPPNSDSDGYIAVNEMDTSDSSDEAMSIGTDDNQEDQELQFHLELDNDDPWYEGDNENDEDDD